MMKLMESNRSHETSSTICYMYEKLLNNIEESYPKLIDKIDMLPSDLPPSFHLVPEIKGQNGEIVQKTAVKFNADKMDIRQVKSLMTNCEYPNMFSNRIFPLVDCVNQYTKAEEKMFWNMQEWRVSTFYPHFIKFKLDQNLKLIGQFKQEEKVVDIAAGKLLRKMPWAMKRTDADIEKMCNSLKAILNPPIEFKIVKGEDIRYWYHENQYAPRSGTLSNSCMRYSSCQEYLDMYCKTDCQMLIAIDKNEKLVGRAILWPRSMWNKNYFDHSDFVMDRIYGTETTIVRFVNYAIKNKFVYKMKQNYTDNQRFMAPDSKDDNAVYIVKEKKMQMKWSQCGFNRWPYVDTFNTLRPSGDGVKNFGDGEMLTETNGYTNDEHCDENECHSCGNTCHSDDLTWINDEQYCCDCSVYSEYMDTSYIQDDAVWSECMQSYLHYDEAYTINIGSNIDDYIHVDVMSTVYLDQDTITHQDEVKSDISCMINYLYDDEEIKFAIYLNEDIMNIDNNSIIRDRDGKPLKIIINPDNTVLPDYILQANRRHWSNHFQYQINYDINEKPYVFITTSAAEQFDDTCWNVILSGIQALDNSFNIKSIMMKSNDIHEELNIIDIVENDISVPTNSIGGFAIKFADLYEKLGALLEHFTININTESNAT